MKRIIRLTVLAVIAFIVIAGLGSSISTVPVGHTGILVTFGRVQDTPLDEGIHFKIPFAQHIVAMDNRVQKMEVVTEAFSKDIQTVTATLAVNYHLEKNTTFSMYRTIGVGFEDILIVPATHEALKSVSSDYTAEQLISQRQKVSSEIMVSLNEEMSKYGVNITAINIVDFDFSPDYIKAVEDKQVAEQRKKQADIENTTIVEKSKSEAEKAKIEAQGLADAALIKSQGLAAQLKIEAQGKAESFKLQNEQLSDKNIKMEWIEKWDGQMPKIQSGDSSMIFDVSTIQE